MASIKETKELLSAFNAISLFLVHRVKDGIDMSDFFAFYKAITHDEDFRQKIMDAYEGITSIPVEVADLSFSEIVDLSTTAMHQVAEIIEAVRS